MQDVLRCTDKEICLLAEQKFYPGLRQAFDEAGIHPTEDGPCIGTPESVIAAVKKRGSPERLHHVIRMLTSVSLDPASLVSGLGWGECMQAAPVTSPMHNTANMVMNLPKWSSRLCCSQRCELWDGGAVHGQVKPLTTEFFGNYTLQDLLGATQAFRLAAAKLRAEGGTTQQALDRLVGVWDGSDALGAALSPLILCLTASPAQHGEQQEAASLPAQSFSLHLGPGILHLSAHQNLLPAWLYACK